MGKMGADGLEGIRAVWPENREGISLHFSRETKYFMAGGR